VALASGGLAASEVSRREQRAADRLGPEVRVLVAADDIRPGARITGHAVALRRLPARFVPPDALASAEAVIGARTAVPVVAGSYLTASLFDPGDEPDGGGSTRGQRTVSVEVAGGDAVAALQPGAKVDVLVSTETGAGGGRTTMALAGAQLLRVQAGGGAYGAAEAGGGAYGRADAAGDSSTAGDPSAAGPPALATLRVSVDQAIYLTAADNFAREIRLLPRPRGDHSRAGASVSQGQL
jgi:pilus assembly protein CpaB